MLMERTPPPRSICRSGAGPPRPAQSQAHKVDTTDSHSPETAAEPGARRSTATRRATRFDKLSMNKWQHGSLEEALPPVSPTGKKTYTLARSVVHNGRRPTLYDYNLNVPNSPLTVLKEHQSPMNTSRRDPLASLIRRREQELQEKEKRKLEIEEEIKKKKEFRDELVQRIDTEIAERWQEHVDILQEIEDDKKELEWLKMA